MSQSPDWRLARTLALDTSAFIYHLEAHPARASRLLPIFQQIERGRCRGVSSTLQMLSPRHDRGRATREPDEPISL